MRPRLFPILMLIPGGLTAQAPSPGPAPAVVQDDVPLFATMEPLTLRLVADFEALADDRADENPERPASILVEGTQEAIRLDVRTRGNFRLRPATCSFPPLRLDFPRSRVEGTVFEGQDKVKLVTFCRDSDDYEQQVLREYVAYRLYNAITDRSFRVRLARITYADELAREDPVTRWGFLIEDDEALAERLGGEIFETPLFDPRDYAPADMLTVSLFEFLIGNTDWSIVEFHNAVLVRLKEGGHVAVPYDFDFSGLVDARYAVVNPTLGIDSVRDRLYRGFCAPDLPYASVYARFLEVRPEIMGLIETQEGLSRGSRRSLRNYVGEFYETLESVPRRERSIERACREVS